VVEVSTRRLVSRFTLLSPEHALEVALDALRGTSCRVFVTPGTRPVLGLLAGGPLLRLGSRLALGVGVLRAAGIE